MAADLDLGHAVHHRGDDQAGGIIGHDLDAGSAVYHGKEREPRMHTDAHGSDNEDPATLPLFARCELSLYAL